MAYYAYRNCHIKDIAHLSLIMDSKLCKGNEVFRYLGQIEIICNNDSLYDDALSVMQEFAQVYSDASKVIK